MRPRSEVALALGLVMGLVALAAAVGAGGRGGEEQDPRASAYLAGPLGTRALSDALHRLGIGTLLSRRLMTDLRGDSAASRRTLVAILNPVVALSGREREELLQWAGAEGGADLLLAGRRASALMACFGYVTDSRQLESVELRAPADGDPRAWPRVSTVLSASTAAVVTDSSRTSDAGITRCVVPPMARIDTLLVSQSGRVVALRLWREGADRRILLVADDVLLRNRSLRDTPAGAFMLGLVAGRYDRVVFDELHQGFEIGGSLMDATIAWSLRSPWGWAVWQLVAVALLALLAGAIRFGPIRPVINRRRRSPLEHVRALATALAAARGHDVAIGAIVQGLHRRLHTSARRGRIDWRAWVDRLAEQLRSPRARDAARTLQSLTRPGQPPEGVLRAANAVEDVWEELRP